MKTVKSWIKTTALAGTLAMAFSVALPLLWAEGKPGAKPLNIVVFLVDDLGWTDTGVYGSKYYETPNIDRLAAEGMRFTDAYAAAALCSPTRASLMTGKSPARLHITDFLPGNLPAIRAGKELPPVEQAQQLPLEERTLAEALKDHGYATAAIGKWHLGEEPYFPDKQGFDTMIGCHHDEKFGGGMPSNYAYFSPYGNPNLTDGPDGEYLTDRLAREAADWIRSQAGRPFFLYHADYSVHTPLKAKAELIAKYAAKNPHEGHKNPTYAAMVESTDQSVGLIMKTIEETGLADNTLMIFTSDNGGLLGGEQQVTSNAPLRAGKGTGYEGGLRVPLIVRWPGVIKPGSVCPTPVITSDIFPTVLDMAGFPLEPDHHLDGISYAPLLRGTGVPERDAFFWHYPHYHRDGMYGVMRQGDWKLIERYDGRPHELYNLAEDLAEERNLAEQEPDRLEAMLERLRNWRTEVNAQMPPGIPVPQENGN